MKNKYDELVNKFVDNELNSNELNQVEELVKSDDNFKLTLSSHKYVHENLYDIPEKTAPYYTTEHIMRRIVEKVSDKYKKSYFFRGIVTTLVCILITFLFMLFFYGSNLEVTQESSKITDYIKVYTKPGINYIHKIVISDMFKTVSGLFSFIVLLGFYFSFNSYKELKKRLKQL